MNTQDEIETDPSEIRRMSVAEWSAWHARVLREARTARNAALADMLIRLATAAGRGLRTLASVFREAFTLRDALTPAREQRRWRGRTHPHQ